MANLRILLLLRSLHIHTAKKGNRMSGLKWNKEFALEQVADDAELLQELLDIFKVDF